MISPTGNEVGPFLAVEQAALSQSIPDVRRTPTFAWYNLVGYVATAVGALAAGVISQALIATGFVAVDAYRWVVIGYALVGVLMALLFRLVGPEVEAPVRPAAADDGVVRRLGLGARSRGIVTRLSALFALDAFGGGFIPQSLMAYWFHLKFGVEPAVLGAIFFAANLLAAVSSLSASRIAARIGLVNTMVFTHLPSNVLLILVPLMPTLPLAVLVLLLRFSLSQMDVPTRQSYVMAVVEPDERSAAAGVTGIARTTGAAISPALVGAARREHGPGRAAVLPRRRAEDRLRPPALPVVHVRPRPGRAALRRVARLSRGPRRTAPGRRREPGRGVRRPSPARRRPARGEPRLRGDPGNRDRHRGPVLQPDPGAGRREPARGHPGRPGLGAVIRDRAIGPGRRAPGWAPRAGPGRRGVPRRPVRHAGDGPRSDPDGASIAGWRPDPGRRCRAVRGLARGARLRSDLAGSGRPRVPR